MKAGRVHYFGPPSAIVIDEIPCPRPKEGELVVRVAAAGVGPWDALLREGKSVVQPSLPIILGSDLAGIVESVGPGVIEFKPGEEVFGVTNKQFCGAYAEYAVASEQMVAAKPASLSFVEAASVPVVAVTAYQMLFDHAQLKAGQAVLIHGAAGNVGAYAVQLAKQAELQVFATAGPADVDYVRGLGAETGDAPATAAIVAHAVGIDGIVCPPGPIPVDVSPEEFAVFAGILPEGKYNLVKAFQKSGHIVGMCGDGADDAPALRQAQMGIAVSTATDVAKSAAGIVLTEPGLGGIVASIKGLSAGICNGRRFLGTLDRGGIR